MNRLAVPRRTMTRDEIETQVRRLGPWFHNLDLAGVQTAPEHFLGDYPRVKWQRFAHAIPDNLEGKTVLDIGCNGGFYSIGIDSDDDYLLQARLAAEICGVEIELRKLSVYDVGALAEEFDVVLFMGVLYHLRHPLLALDLIRRHVAKDLFVFQSMQRGSNEVASLEDDYEFWNEDVFEKPGFPRLCFIEKKYSGDPTNWWVPNRACSEAMLRSAGFTIEANPETEVYVCRCAPITDDARHWPGEIKEL
jgi:tRNA (mo5U34)-methyltransferase